MKRTLILTFSLLLSGASVSAQSGRPEGRHYEQTDVRSAGLQAGQVRSAGLQAGQVRSAGLQAGQTLQLSVDDAVRRAVEHNPDLAGVRLGTQVEAARRLGKSLETVRKQTKLARARLRARTNAQAVGIAVSLDLI